jgi:RNA polymerase sigma-70 factor (ECF subfamily)
MPETVTDQRELDLIARAQTQRDAFAELVERHYARVLNHCSRIVWDYHVAEDMAQETFVRAFVNLNRYDPQYRFISWVLRIATNLCINTLRSRGRAKVTEMTEIMEADVPAPEATPDQVVGRKSLIEQLLARLAPIPRTVFLMFHQDGYTAPEIADALEMPVGTVKTHLHRARLALTRAAAQGGVA